MSDVYVIHVDLKGSRLGPAWLSVDISVDRPPHRSLSWLRKGAAGYYEVPLAQVGKPVLESEWCPRGEG